MFLGTHNLASSVAEVLVLQRQVNVGILHQSDDGLKIITLLATDAQLVALDSGLHFELAAFDHLDELPRQVRVDPFAHDDLLPGLGAAEHGFLFVEAGYVDATLGELLPEYVEHLFELEIRLCRQCHGLAVELEFRARSLEIESRIDLAIGLVDTIAGLVGIKITNHVKRRHQESLWVRLATIAKSWRAAQISKRRDVLETPKMLQMAVNSDHVPNGVGPGDAGQLCYELGLAGAESLLTFDSDGALTTGVALATDAVAMHPSGGAAARFRQQASDALARGLPLSVSVCGLGEGTDIHAAFSGVCDQLRFAMDDTGTSWKDIEVVVDADTVLPQRASAAHPMLAHAVPVYVLLSKAMMQAGSSQTERALHEQFWLQLWLARANRRVRAAFAPIVVPQCSLLSAEPAMCIQPLTALQVPEGTAWLPMRLNVARFANDSGILCESAIEKALRRCVDIGDALHDLIRWPTAKIRHDAWLNRRLALELTGFGDLVMRRSLDPQCFATLQELCELLRWMQGILQRHSRAMAQKTEYLPAISESDPSREFPSGQVRNGWRSRWLKAVEAAAVRHRNLLVLSPWSIFPEHQPADYRYSDLLPVLAFSDACAFPPPPVLATWDISEFTAFHKRAWAVLQQRSAAYQIAEGL